MADVLHLSKRLLSPPEPFSVAGVELRHFQGEADISLWLDLRHRAFARATPGILGWSTSDFAVEFLKRPWWSPDRIWFAETCPGNGETPQVVGTVAVADRSATESAVPAVHWLAVLPQWRRRGIGRLLLTAVEERCWRQGQREIFLETHAGWSAAGRLYRSLGYKPVFQIPSPTEGH